MFIIETKDALYFTPRKLDAAYKHVTFKFKDRARFKEVTETQFKSVQRRYKGKTQVEL